jgi:protein-S-isoprenylcysteine O-methyltransferase Ste14
MDILPYSAIGNGDRVTVAMAAEPRDLPRYTVPPHVPPVVALIAIVVLAIVAPVHFLPKAVSLVVGIPLFAFGLGFWIWGFRSLLRQGESPHPLKPTDRLLTDGALAVSRNPIYTGGTIGMIGLAVLLDTATGIAVVVLLGLVAYGATVAEERYLEAKFGQEYREYKSRVRRWL